jgi:hypothetical protein
VIGAFVATTIANQYLGGFEDSHEADRIKESLASGSEEDDLLDDETEEEEEEEEDDLSLGDTEPD